jgi:hypothetical protein
MIGPARQLLLFASLLTPVSAIGGTVSLGVFSFDNLIPDGATPGVNVFNISNYTGSFDLPPDLPVATGVTLQNAVLNVDIDGGGSVQIMLGDIGPGVFTPPDAAEFTDTIAFTDATLTATLDNISLILDGGSAFTADPSISATILPSTGPDLAAGTDFAIITASEAGATTPEPSTAPLLAVVAGASVAALTVRRRKTLKLR